MSEYTNVELPFLEKLEEIGWTVINHSLRPSVIPQDPSVSRRNSFREIILKDEFAQSLKRINKTEKGGEWLTDKQIEDIERLFIDYPGKGLIEVNRTILQILRENTVTDVNEITGDKNPKVRIIDYDHPENNSFIAVNQFRVDTPGSVREAIIPDIVLFVNGLPLVVIECKDNDAAEPLSEAFDQISRYSNRREPDSSIREGEEKLFYTNLFNIISYGDAACFGTITGGFDHYLNWKDIFPEEYKTIDVSPNEQRQEVLIRGMLNKSILVDILKNFTLFTENKKGELIKVVCRYQQYRAVGKIIDRLRNGETLSQKCGVVWHTQGSGKSLTMVFLVRKMYDSNDLHDYKVIIINDRVELEKQFSETVVLTGIAPVIIGSKKEIDKLKTANSNLNLVMLHKFQPANGQSVQELIDSGIIPEYENFPVLNESQRILILVDEAHRTQGGDMAGNLFDAFPNAVKIGFTGTPLMTDRCKQQTYKRFGTPIDTYKMSQSVADRATVDILYIGRTSRDHILDKDKFKDEFEDMFRNRTEKERQEIQKRYVKMVSYLEAEDRIKKIAKDIIAHYTTEVMVNGFKAQVVASSILAACRYKKALEEEIAEEIERVESGTDIDEERLRLLRFIKVAAVVSMAGNNEEAVITLARKHAHDCDAVENFKRDFDFEKPETGIAILCVCDRLLTGFDAPIDQAMYLDKNLREHDLMQAIARVNRTKVMKNGYVKEHGLLIDYYGIAANLEEALAIFNEDDKKELFELDKYFRNIDKEIPVLEARYLRIVQLFADYGVNEFENFIQQKIENKKDDWDIAEQCVELAVDLRFRAQFDTNVKSFFDSLDLLYNTAAARDYYIPAMRIGFLVTRIRERYKDKTMDLKWAGAKVRKLIDKYLISLGIDYKVPPTNLLSDDFPSIVSKSNKSAKAKASEMEHAIRYHIKVNMEKDPALYTRFSERLQRIIDVHKENWEKIVEEFEKFREEMKTVRKLQDNPVSEHEMPFFDMIASSAGICEENTDEYKAVSGVTRDIYIRIKEFVAIPNCWKKHNERKILESYIYDTLNYCKVESVETHSLRLTSDIISLAEKRDTEVRNS